MIMDLAVAQLVLVADEFDRPTAPRVAPRQKSPDRFGPVIRVQIIALTARAIH